MCLKQGCESKPRFVAAPPLPHALLHIPLSRPVVTYLCRECLAQVCPTKEPCLKGASRKPGESVTNHILRIYWDHIGLYWGYIRVILGFRLGLCRGMAAQACYKPSAFDSQPSKAESQLCPKGKSGLTLFMVDYSIPTKALRGTWIKEGDLWSLQGSCRTCRVRR